MSDVQREDAVLRSDGGPVAAANMPGARFIVGDVFDVLATIPDGSVDLVLTSPPFLALRSYLPPDHPHKAKEIGSEPTPAAFIDTLLDLTARLRRVLAPHGSICVELGDTYSGSGGAGGDYGPGGLREGQERFDGSASKAFGLGAAPRPARNRSHNPGFGWPMEKSLCLIPELYRVGLVYGVNPLNGTPSPAGNWRARNVVRWCRPNPPVGALGDKFRPGTSEMVVACVSGQRYFDLDAVRGNPEDVKDQRHRSTNGPKQDADPSEVLTANYHQRVPSNPAGPPPLDWWNIPTQAYPGSHYATWPMALCERPIKAMCPQRVCTTCGEPSRRIVGEAEYVNARTRAPVEKQSWLTGERNAKVVTGQDNGQLRQAPTLGWTDCGHDSWRPGVVLDPFAGSGTTLAAATGHGRDCIGIDLDARNADLARERVGMFLTVDEPETAA